MGIDEHGVRASKYGAHLFHTKFERVWDYVQQFSEWIPFDHRVKGRVPDKEGVKQLVPIPPTQETVNTLFGADVHSEAEIRRGTTRSASPRRAARPPTARRPPSPVSASRCTSPFS